MSACPQIDQDSSLITIHRSDEQEFLNNLLHSYNEISSNAWLGMKYTNKSFEWVDGTKVNYSNWADDAMRDGSGPCVLMSLVKANLGKWLDDSCKREALIVCQKKQVFTLNTLRTAFESMENKMSETLVAVEDKMKILELSTIPRGFLYTQLPEQSPPEQLWPHMKWTEVTEKYAGLFFRAEGNTSEPFGQVQSANQSTISTFRIMAAFGNAITPYDTDHFIPASHGWNNISWTTSYNYTYPFYSMGVHITTGDVRPVNTAVRIWKRIG